MLLSELGKALLEVQTVLSCGVFAYVVTCIGVADDAHGGVVVQYAFEAGIGIGGAIGDKKPGRF
jgi:hypothetical protein